jgi:hypothetical protein
MTGTAMEIIAWLSTQKDGMTFDCDYHKEKRSLSANSLYWACVTKLAAAMKEPNAFVHNLMLRRLGILELYDDKPARILLPDSEVADHQTMYDTDYHLYPVRGTSGVVNTKEGRMRWYMMLKHSSDFNTAEMSRLIDAISDEMRHTGIVPPQDEEIQRALDNYERTHK